MQRILKQMLGRIGFEISRVPVIKDDCALYRNYFSEETIARKAFYNISFGGHFGFGGNFSHPFWTNIDVDHPFPEPWPRCDIERDIRFDPFTDGCLPLENDSAEIFHSRFAFEHIADSHAINVMREIHRCLKSGGVFHVVVPNLEFDYHAYMNRDWSYFTWIPNFSKPEMMELMRYSIPMRDMSMSQVFLTHFAANASPHHLDGCENPIGNEEFSEIMNRYAFEAAMDFCVRRCSLDKQKIYRQNHVNWWSPEKMQRFLRDAGFSRIIPLSPGQSVSPILRENPRFDRLWSDIALVIEAVK